MCEIVIPGFRPGFPRRQPPPPPEHEYSHVGPQPKGMPVEDITPLVVVGCLGDDWDLRRRK